MIKDKMLWSLIGLNVFSLFIAIAMLIAGLLYSRATMPLGRLPDSSQVEKRSAELIGQPYSQAMHDDMAGVLNVSERLLSSSAGMHESSAKVIRNFGFALVGLSMVSLILLVRVKESK